MSSLFVPVVAPLPPLDPGVFPPRAAAFVGDDDSTPAPTKPAEALREGVALKDSRMNFAMSGRPKLRLTSWAMGGGMSPCSPHPELSSWRQAGRGGGKGATTWKEQNESQSQSQSQSKRETLLFVPFGLRGQ